MVGCERLDKSLACFFGGISSIPTGDVSRRPPRNVLSPYTGPYHQSQSLILRLPRGQAAPPSTRSGAHELQLAAPSLPCQMTGRLPVERRKLSRFLRGVIASNAARTDPTICKRVSRPCPDPSPLCWMGKTTVPGDAQPKSRPFSPVKKKAPWQPRNVKSCRHDTSPPNCRVWFSVVERKYLGVLFAATKGVKSIYESHAVGGPRCPGANQGTWTSLSEAAYF